MANYNETDNFKTIVARKKQLTITLTINGVFTSVCKKWVQNICQDINCPNYHPTKKLCYFFQQGNCKNGNYCYYLHPPELQPKEIYRKELDYYNQEYNIILTGGGINQLIELVGLETINEQINYNTIIDNKLSYKGLRIVSEGLNEY